MVTIACQKSLVPNNTSLCPPPRAHTHTHNQLLGPKDGRLISYRQVPIACARRSPCGSRFTLTAFFTRARYNGLCPGRETAVVFKTHHHTGHFQLSRVKGLCSGCQQILTECQLALPHRTIHTILPVQLGQYPTACFSSHVIIVSSSPALCGVRNRICYSICVLLDMIDG